MYLKFLLVVYQRIEIGSRIVRCHYSSLGASNMPYKGLSSPDQVIRRCSFFLNVGKLEAAASGLCSSTVHTIGSLFILPFIKAPHLSSLKVSGATVLSLIWRHDTGLPLARRAFSHILSQHEAAENAKSKLWMNCNPSQYERQFT
ncbi:set and mynd domain-containing protein 3 [Moniliophthora roreri]|nr:set and mynd domain-containing protein 3 [Moniliophthora roreri]